MSPKDPTGPKPEKTDGAFERTDVISRTRVLAGKYRLGKLLGEGGMGAVYAAEHTGLGAKVAIKLLSEGGSLDQKALTRFRREARAMGAIRHENVVSVMDTGADDDGIPYLVMELLEGESLAAMLRRERVLSPKLAAWIASQVLAGLSAAHSNGVIHRDLKPGNVFIARQSDGTHRVKILDFGISKLNDASQSMNVTADGALVGTPNFMAPEQITGQGPIDARVDIYAVGVLLYRMVAGRLPFVGKTSEELYRRILAGQPIMPRKRQPEIPAELEATILKAMSLDRENRFPDAQSFRLHLTEILPTLAGESPVPSGLDAMPLPGEELSIAQTVAAQPSALQRKLAASSQRSGQGRTMHIDRRRWPWLLAAAIFVASGAIFGALALHRQHAARHGAAAYDGPPLRYGVVRYISKEDVIAVHQPLADYLSDALHRPVLLVIAEDDKDLMQQFFAGHIDLAGMSPYTYVRAKRREPTIRLLAKPTSEGGPTYQGLIVARADSAIRTLDDLKGKTFCYVRPGSASGYLYPRALLRQAGIDPDKDFASKVFGREHVETLRLLDTGVCDAAAVYARALKDGEQKGMPSDRFHQIAATERIPWDAYCVTERLPTETATALQQALLALAPNSDQAAHLFRDDKGTPKGDVIGFIPATDADYEGVRRIEHLLDDAGK